MRSTGSLCEAGAEAAQAAGASERSEDGFHDGRHHPTLSAKLKNLLKPTNDLAEPSID